MLVMLDARLIVAEIAPLWMIPEFLQGNDVAKILWIATRVYKLGRREIQSTVDIDRNLFELECTDTESILCVVPKRLHTYAVRMMKRRLVKRFVKKITAHLRRKKNQQLQTLLFQEKAMNEKMPVPNRDLHPNSEQICHDAFCSDSVDSITSSTASVAVAATVERCTSSSCAGHTKPMLSSDSGIGDLDGEWWNEEEVEEEEEEDAFLALEDWSIAASEMSLEKVVSQTKAETLYRYAVGVAS